MMSSLNEPTPADPTRLETGIAEGGLRRVLWVATALTVFFGPLDISADGALMTVGLDPYVMMKLIVSGMATGLAVWGVLSCGRVRDVLQSVPAMLVLGILALVLLAAPTAVTGSSLPTTLINIAYVGFAATALAGLGVRGIATATLFGVAATTVGAWGLYLWLPRYGVFPEKLPGGVVIERLGGMGHPNAVSRSAMIGLLLCLYLYRVGKFDAKKTIAICVPLALAAYLAWSRTVLFSGVIAIGVLFIDRLTTRFGASVMVATGLAGLIGVAGLFAIGQEERLVEAVLSKITKSGDLEEITSGTGRSEIWSYAADLIRERPTIGHGFNAAPTLLINHSQATHNAVLHASLAGGVLAGVLMITLLIWNLATALLSSHRLISGLSTFLLLSCLMEDTILETFPGPCTLLWLACTFYPILSHSRNLLPATLAQVTAPVEMA